jgi:glycosyltransferase involved in cell wall biosynthesis
VIGFVGSYFAWEGLSLLLDALPKMVAQRPGIRVLLVGGGNEEEALRRQVGRLGMQDAVVFAGRVPHTQVAGLYAAIDVLVYPRLPMRLTELVTPLKPLEAMALGKLLIASDVGGHRELIQHGNTGLLFPAGNAAALAATALRMLSDSALQARCQSQGPAFIRAERTWERIVPRYNSVYQRVYGGAS